ncbi:MAG: pilus assembly protein [Lachnospiraceae bacterium]
MRYNHSKENPTHIKRASIFTSYTGSVTVEASLVVPVFFLAVVCLIYLLEIMAIQISIRNGLHYAGKRVSQEAYITPMISSSDVETMVVQTVGSERLRGSIVVGGSSGLHCQDSRIGKKTAEIKIVVKYKVQLPIPTFGKLALSCKDEIRCKGWTGYVKGGFGQTEEEIVYITETGVVYHKDYECTYLELSIHRVSGDSIEDLRNQYHGRYYPCEKCAHGKMEGGVYITNTGDRYHNSLNCSGLKRSIYAVPLSEAVGKGACSRCGQ